jgi:putative hydrolase of the HAD superfamily
VVLGAVLLDFDDTLTDHARVEQEAWEVVAGLITRRVPAVDLAALRARYHAAFDHHYRAMLDGTVDFPGYRRARLAEALAPWHDLDDALFVAYTEAKNTTIDGASLFPDALPTIARLRRAGLRVGVLTNGPSEIQRRKLRATGVEPRVDAVLVSEEIGVAKPDARAFAIAATALDTAPEHIAMVGDSLPNDVVGALAAGFGRVVWIARRDGQAPAGALRVDGLTAAADLLLGGQARECG